MNSLLSLVLVGAATLLLVPFALVGVFYAACAIKIKVTRWIARPLIEKERSEIEKAARQREQAMLFGAVTVAERLTGRILEHALVLQEQRDEAIRFSMMNLEARTTKEPFVDLVTHSSQNPQRSMDDNKNPSTIHRIKSALVHPFRRN